MKRPFVVFREIILHFSNIIDILRSYLKIALIATKTATWVNFNTVIAVAIDMSVKYAKVQAS